MLDIIHAPNAVLSQSAKPVTVRYPAKQISKVDNNILKLLKEMGATLLSAKDPIGVGLAAPQVGCSLRIFIAKSTEKSKIQVFINPKIIEKTEKEDLTNDSDRLKKLNKNKKKSRQTKLEGCLSLPDIWGEVKRNPVVTLSYQLTTNNHKLITKTSTFSGFMATIIQHEIDHLDGILFPKRVLDQKGTLYKSHKNEKNEDVFEEVDL